MFHDGYADAEIRAFFEHLVRLSIDISGFSIQMNFYQKFRAKIKR
jgi:hypothetical protein